MPALKRERDEEEDELEEPDCEEAEDAQHENHTDEDEGEEVRGCGVPRSCNDWEEFFAEGTVKVVKMHDFMTYNGTITVKPGPRLNLVLGPNGTGKSSFVCALCIGLNGSPKTLGRADNLSDYVRRGASSFWIEITLSSGGKGRDFAVRRTVTLRKEREADGSLKDRYDSKWMLNGRDVPAREVDKLIKRLNIQFDNLCQFLPQDKVPEFARMDKYELLSATLKALGDSSLYDQHQKLIQLRKDEKQAAADHDSGANRLAKLKADHDRQRRDYERFQQREKLMLEAQSLRCQAKWLEVYGKSKVAEAAKKRWEEAVAVLQELEDRQQDDMRPISEKKELIARVKQEKMAIERQAREADGRVRRYFKHLADHDSDMTALIEELSALDAHGKVRQENIARARQRLAAAEAQLAQAPDRAPKSFDDRMAELRTLSNNSRREVLELEAQQNNLTSQVHGVMTEIGRVKGRLDTLNSRKYQMLQKLAGAAWGNRNIADLHSWVEQHRTDGTFRGPVFGPIALEMSVKAVAGIAPSQAAQYVESSCWHWLSSYIVTCREDEKLLNEEARRRKVGPNVKVIASDYDPNAPFTVDHPAGQARQYDRLGITHSVDELIEAPPIIMQALVRSAKVNTVYIGSNHAVTCLTAIAEHTPIRTLLVGGINYTLLRSLYAKNTSTGSVDLHPCRLFVAGGGGSEADAEMAALVDQERTLLQERDRLESEIEGVRQAMRQLEEKQQEWNREVQNIHSQIQAMQQKRVQLITAVETAKRQLRNAEAVPDPEARRPLLRKAIEEKLEEHANLCRRLLEETQASWAGVRAVQVLELQLTEASAQLRALEDARKQVKEKLGTASNAAQDAENAFRSYKRELKNAEESAAEHYPPSDADKKEIRRHQELGTPPAKLVAQAAEKEKEAEQVVCNNQNVVAEFRRRESELATLTQVVQKLKDDLQDLRKSIDELKGLWLPEIQKMVETINNSFSTNFKEIGYAGEVRLQEHDDFDKYAVEILVQFRANEGMQPLTANRQSGGERSVSTILYLIALQAVTSTPFRVVDEINQGMDPINERKVFQQLVEASSADHTPQCFLLTPKLLNDLEYSPNIAVLELYSGPENIDDHLLLQLRTGDYTRQRQMIFGGRGAQLVATA